MELANDPRTAPDQAMGAHPREFMGGFLLAMLCLQSANHGFRLAASGNPRWIVPHLVSLLHDGVLLIFLYFLSIWGVAVLADRLGNATIRRLLVALWIPPMTLLMLYPRYIADFLHFPVNIFTVDPGSAATFARHFLTWHEIAMPPLLIMLFAGFLTWTVPRRTVGMRLPVMILFVAVIGVTLCRPSPNPVVFGIQESLISLVRGERRIVPRLQRWSPEAGCEAPSSPQAFSAACLAVAETRGLSHILVIVMETVEQPRFRKSLMDDPQTFIGSRRAEFRAFTRYHTPNLDSYTSLVAMLTGVAVPFQAYNDPERFAGVERAPSLPEALRLNGWRTAFVCTARHQPFIPVRQAWDRIIEQRDLPNDASFIGIESPPIEAGVEDRAALPAILEFMRTNPKTFILQECLFGHTQAWMDLTRLSQLGYMDRYVQEVNQALESAGLRGSTLLVLVADHGSREDAGNPENYHVPLLMAGPGVSPGLDERFLSHTDFCGLLAETASSGVRIQPTREVLTVGHSGSWVYGQIRDDHACQFIDNARGEPLRPGNGLDPAILHRRFQQRLNSFARRFPDPRLEETAGTPETTPQPAVAGGGDHPDAPPSML